METKELIEELEKMGFKIEIYLETGDIKAYDGYGYVAYVGTKDVLSIDTQFEKFNKLEEKKKAKLFNLLTEYASTPIENRGEEKKYMYRVKKIDNLIFRNSHEDHYLNYDKKCGECFLSDNKENLIVKTKFTHMELKALGVDIEQLKEVCEEIEV